MDTEGIRQTNALVQSVFNVAEGIPAGWVWILDGNGPESFLGFDQLLLLTEKMSARECRIITPAKVPKGKWRFYCTVKVMFRQHNSIQGEVTVGINGKPPMKRMFKSALELLELLSQFADMNTKEETRGTKKASV